MDDSTGSAVLAAVGRELAGLWEALVSAETLELETVEQTVRDGVLAIGARLLEAGIAARGTGKQGPHKTQPISTITNYDGGVHTFWAGCRS